MNKLVSILLPTYNGAKRIREAIESVLGQSYPHFELLVLDDDSEDDTKQIVNKLMLGDHRIKYMRNEINLGIQKTLNRGVNEGAGEYIARIDDDDVWVDKDKLLKQVEFLENHPDHVLLGTALVAIDDNGKEVFRHIPACDDEEIRGETLNRNCFTHSSVIFRKDAALKCGGYSELPAHRHIEDYVLWLKLGTIGKLANLPTYSVRLALHPQSLSSQNKILQLQRSIAVIKEFKEIYPNFKSANLSLHIRLIGYAFLNIKPLRRFFPKIYKFYRNT